MSASNQKGRIKGGRILNYKNVGKQSTIMVRLRPKKMPKEYRNRSHKGEDEKEEGKHMQGMRWPT